MHSVLLGAVESTRVALERMAAHSLAPRLVWTLSPEAGKRRHSDYCDLRPLCRRLGVPVEDAPESSEEYEARLKRERPDFLWVIGWSRLLPPSILGIPRQGAIAFHPSLLPENRGRAVIPWTILLGLKRTGATLFWMDQGADSGDILDQLEIEVVSDETSTSLYEKHLGALGFLLDRALPVLRCGSGPRRPQDHSRATYCAKRTPQDGWIDWSRPAREICTLVRAATRPYPGAFTTYQKQRLVIWGAELIPLTPPPGTPGQVVAIEGSHIVICCGDGEFIKSADYTLDGEKLLTVKARLGPFSGNLSGT